MPRAPRKAVKGKSCRLQVVVSGETAAQMDEWADRQARVLGFPVTRSDVARSAIFMLLRKER